MGFILLIFFGIAAYVAIRLWQQHDRRKPIRTLEERREDLKDLAEEADLQEEIDEEATTLRDRGIDIDDHDEDSNQ